MNRIDADEMLGRLRAALRRLDEDQGPVARRNARSAVASALNSLRKTVDARFPRPTPKPPRRQGRRSASQQPGFLCHPTNKRALWASSAGVRPLCLPLLSGFMVTFPAYVEAAMSVSDMKRLKKDQRYRRARLTELALQKEKGPTVHGAF